MALKVILSNEHPAQSDTTAEISSARAGCLIRANPPHRWFTIPAPVPPAPASAPAAGAGQPAGLCAGWPRFLSAPPAGFQVPGPRTGTWSGTGTWPPRRYLSPVVLCARILLLPYAQPPVFSGLSFLIAAALIPGVPDARAGSCQIEGYAGHWPGRERAGAAAGRGNGGSGNSGQGNNGQGNSGPAERRPGETDPGAAGSAQR